MLSDIYGHLDPHRFTIILKLPVVKCSAQIIFEYKYPLYLMVILE